MKKTLIVCGALIILAIAYWLISPLFITRTVSESSPIVTGAGTTTAIVIAEGSFTGFDRLHTGSGTAKLIRTDAGYIMRFEDDFVVTNGPDLYVGFGKDGSYVKGSEIGRLKGNVGSQNYGIPAEVSLDEYNEVWVWCKAFSVPFAKAAFVALD